MRIYKIINYNPKYNILLNKTVTWVPAIVQKRMQINQSLPLKRKNQNQSSPSLS